MKCIKATRTGKYQTAGEIKRVEDQDAYSKVDSGNWKFVAKKEWKAVTRKPKEEEAK